MLNLFRRSQPVTAIAPPTAPRTVRHLRNWEAIDDNARRHRPFMTLERPDECLVLTTMHWLYVVQFAATVGTWRPAGTDAEQTSLLSHGPKSYTLPRGTYWPLGQRVDEADARGIATGIARGLERLPALVGGVNSPQQWPVEDRRLWPSFESPDVVRLVDLHALDIDQNLDVFQDFLSRGAFTIDVGLPVELATESAFATERRRQHAALVAERDRLISAVASGAITEPEAAPRLHALRTTIANLQP